MASRLKVAGMALLLVLAFGPWHGSLSVWLSAQAQGARSRDLDTSGIEWLWTLPKDEWQRLDNGEQGIEQTRWLLNSIVHQARLQMDLVRDRDGGEFERAIRKYIFYFQPAYEYWFPPHADLERGLGNPVEERIPKQVRWPAWVKPKSVPEGRPYDENVVIHLGREEDDERDIYVKFVGRELYDFKLMRWRYLSERVREPPKVEELKLAFTDSGAEFTRTYYNDNESWEVYRRETLMEFARGNPSPVVDNTGDEPELELAGVRKLFLLEPDDWEGVDGFFVFRALINLARLQFGLTEEGGEFEALLRRDFFYYYPWEPWYESVDVERQPLGPAVREVEEEFLFDVGGGHTSDRDLIIGFLKSYAIPGVFDWGIARIIHRDFFPTPEGVPGTEERIFWLDLTLPTPRAYYDLVLKNPDGSVKEQRRLAEFIFGNPDPVD
jgi:hypothetical protein